MKLTAGPHSDPDKSLTTGHAAHIHAASPGGPRYDPDQTEAQRKSIKNGIWLCRDCGDIVDKDAAAHSANDLRAWKANHEAMIGETRKQGYASSVALLRISNPEPLVANRIINLFEDKRVFWTAFHGEVPAHVRQSLDAIRVELRNFRSDVPSGGPLDMIIVSLGQTIRRFYDHMALVDLNTLRCDGQDPDWTAFEGALAALRKAIGLQVLNLAAAYDIQLQGEFGAYVEVADKGRD